jgi:hypothetical protein
VAGFEKILRHGPAHDPETDKSNLRHEEIIAGVRSIVGYKIVR